MKKLLFCVLLSAIFVSCDKRVEELNIPAGTSVGSPMAVNFDAYNSRNTRSGLTGVTTLETLKNTKAGGGGFGVFAYYTDIMKYSQTYIPNFMYNQGVFWNGADGTISANTWLYEPVMYWPNEYGSDAASADEDLLSFFAYAPYVESVSASAGSVTDATQGIVGFSRNSAVGDPMVRYIASFKPEESVDLCWGVVPSDNTTWERVQGDLSQTLTEGLPWLDVYRPKETASQTAATSSRVKFNFKHALAQLNVQIDTDADVTTHMESGDELASSTKVYVRSISFTGIARQGVLNLNNTIANKALWLDWCGCTDLPFGEEVTVHDGRRDSREGAAGAESYNETPQGLNPAIVQNSYTTLGVTNKLQNLFEPYTVHAPAIQGQPTDTEIADGLNDAIMVIPTGEPMSVTIVYDIETESPNLSGFISDGRTHGVSIENKITKAVIFGEEDGAGLENNKRYTLKLHLGMNSVKFDAEVGSWGSSTIEGEATLPGSQESPITFGPTVEPWDDSLGETPVSLSSSN